MNEAKRHEHRGTTGGRPAAAKTALSLKDLELLAGGIYGRRVLEVD